MTATRSRKERNFYSNYLARRKKRKNVKCEFCLITNGHKDHIQEAKYFKVIRNVFPYSIWDGQDVSDHLMIVPQMHTDHLGDLPKTAGSELLTIIGEYEAQGYNFYARAPQSKIKSVLHHHTHLIKPKDKEAHFILFFQKPYMRIAFFRKNKSITK